jgi:hypothetical protein
MSEHQFKEDADQDRRDFLKTGVGLAAATLAPGILLYGMSAYGRAPDEPASSKVRWGMLIDTTKCAALPAGPARRIRNGFASCTSRTCRPASSMTCP